MIDKADFLKLDDLSKLEYVVKMSLEEYRGHKSDYWNGSKYMGECVLEAINRIRKAKQEE